MMKGFRLLSLGMFLLLVGFFGIDRTDAQTAKPAATSTAPAPNVKMPEVMAEVNSEKIMKTELAAECLRLHGEEELKDQIKKFLIQIECNRLKIVVTQEEINAEVVRMAKTFGFSSEDWLSLLDRERGITPNQYMKDIIWPILAIGKLAGSKMNISEQEIQREFDARFGPAVQVRQIVLRSRADAERVLAEVRANPESFSSAAKNHSLDPASKPYGGLIHPIRRHSVNPNIEQVVFAMKPGDISPAIEWPAGQFIIFRCEQHLQSQDVDRAGVRDQLIMKIRDMKTRQVSEQVFTDLYEKARIEVLLGNPARMAQAPGVAAIVNGQTISVDQLSDICLERYGKAVLEEIISRMIVEQACRKEKIAITDADIDAEIREMAIKFLPLKQDGTPNVELWMKRALEENRVPAQIYRTNTIWPVLALKRLSRHLVQVTEEDIQKAYEANFGPKVRCLAIAFDQKDHRRALEVWEMANRQRTPENFGDLAEKFSNDSESKMARGVIPPIGRYCGQPILEKEAFGLLPNEISQIIQLDDSLVILYCLGHEESTIKDINDVKSDLLADIFEKKQKLAVARYYEALMNQAAVDNYLTRESKNAELEKAIIDSQKNSQATGGAPLRK